MANKLSRGANIGIAFGCVVAISSLLGLYTWWSLNRSRAQSPEALEARRRSANNRSIKLSRAVGRAELGSWMTGLNPVPEMAQTRHAESESSTPDSRETWRMSSILEAAKDDRDAEIRLPPPVYTKRTVPAYSRNGDGMERMSDRPRWYMARVDSSPWDYMGATVIF